MTTEEYFEEWWTPKELPKNGFNKTAMLDFAEWYAQQRALRQPPVSGSLLSDVDYWKQRCLLAEQCLEESPCDPDITSDQIKAWNAYHKFISWAGNDH